MEYSVKVKHVTKRYKLYKDKWGPIKELLFKQTLHKDFLALDDVSLELPKGEAIGILGRNGSGKSTLLKIITGIADANQGDVHVDGALVFLDVSSGIDPELTGYDNIFLKGTLLGYTEQEMAEKVERIIEFSELGEFIYQPVKNYSSGMKSKLGFAISVNVDPDILIVDEALAVGDSMFRQKCMAKMNQFKDAGKTIIFVSHDRHAIESFCSKAAWLHQGKLIGYGDAKKVGAIYNAFMNDEMNLQSAELSLSYTAFLEDISLDTSDSTLDFSLTGRVTTQTAVERPQVSLAIRLLSFNQVVDLSKPFQLNETFSASIDLKKHLAFLSGYDVELGCVVKNIDAKDIFIPFESRLNVDELKTECMGQAISLKSSRNVTFVVQSIASLDQQATRLAVQANIFALDGRYSIKNHPNLTNERHEVVLSVLNTATKTEQTYVNQSQEIYGTNQHMPYHFEIDLQDVVEGSYKFFLQVRYQADQFVKKAVWSSLKSYDLQEHYVVGNHSFQIKTKSKWLEMTTTKLEG
ncbi:ABC transporter ATP-binding protein [Exiguobacterium sp. s6]|uniref:ABC transporter ATP-binding protein n=1 Tax=Exiguobacterium sp. s6 TaxID=2751236 RepID=UPI001BECE23C|nr:ABC transporter ATP-binding protein [Exiguobacterium sp. s6]